MQEDYSSLSVCVCVSVTTLGATSLIFKSNLMYHRLLYDGFLDLDSPIFSKRLCSRDMALFAYHHNAGLFQLTQDTRTVIDTTSYEGGASSSKGLTLNKKNDFLSGSA